MHVLDIGLTRSVSPELPAGLVLDGASGKISGAAQEAGGIVGYDVKTY